MNNGVFHRARGGLQLLPCLILAACGSSMKIQDRPISFSEARVENTETYIAQHYGLTPGTIEIVPRIIVLHWTAIDDAEKSFNVFNQETLAGSRPDLQNAGEVNVAIHFLVTPQGKILRLMPETWMARHCIGLNYHAIGVENAGGQNGVDNLTDAQIEANIRLVRYLAEKYPTIEYLIGHYEYRLFEGHPLWLERDDSYRTEKTDPGERFMRRVRAGVAGLHLKGPEEIAAEKQAVQNAKSQDGK